MSKVKISEGYDIIIMKFYWDERVAHPYNYSCVERDYWIIANQIIFRKQNALWAALNQMEFAIFVSIGSFKF